MAKSRYTKEDVMNSLETFVKLADQYKLIGLEKNNIYPMEIEILEKHIKRTRSPVKLETMFWHIEAATENLKKGFKLTRVRYKKQLREDAINSAKGTITELASHNFLEEQLKLNKMLEEENWPSIRKKADLLAQRRKDFMERKGEMRGKKIRKGSVQTGLERFAPKAELGGFKTRKKYKRRKKR